MEIEFPTIQTDVPGPGGEPGLLLFAPRSEALEWDVHHEVVSNSRYWIQDRQAWWIAAPYLHTAEDIVRRYATASSPRTVELVAPPTRPEPDARAAPSPVPATGWDRMSSLLTDRWRRLEARLRRAWRARGAADSA